MLDRLIDGALRNRLLVITTAAVIVGWGLFSWRNLPIDAFPDPTPPQAQVFILVPGFPPEDVEALVTFPIEAAMSGLPNVEEVRSLSKFGLSVVTVIFERGTDWYFARQLVFQQITEAREDLPPVAEPIMGPITTGLSRVVTYIIEAPSDMSPYEVRALQDWLIALRLKSVPGVNEVVSFGGFEKQYQVIVDPRKLLQYDLTLEDVAQSIKQNNLNQGGQFLELPTDEEALVSGRGLVKSVEDIASIVIRSVDGTPIYVRNVAEVQLGPAIRRGAVTFMDEGGDYRGDVVSGVVMQLINTNTKVVTEDLRERIDELNQSLPGGVRIRSVIDQMVVIERALGTVERALIEGGILVVAVLLFFLYEVRSALIVAVSIPLSVLIAFVLMERFGLSANLMSLGGLTIGIGMMVDASVVMVENIHRHLVGGRSSGEPRIHIVARAAKEVARPVTFAILIIIIVFIPLFTLRGVEGVMFSAMAYTISFAMLGSLVIALTLAPVLSSLLLGSGIGGRGNPLFEKTKAGYLFLLRRAIDRRKTVIASAGIALVGSLALLPFFGTEFLPILDEGYLEIRVAHLRSTTLKQSVRTGDQIMEVVSTFPEVEHILSQTGRPEAGMDPEPISNSELVIKLKPREEWVTADNYTDLINAINRKVQASVSGVVMNVSRPLANHINELLSGIRAQIAVKIFGEDLETLTDLADQVRDIMATVPGMEDLVVEPVMGKYQVKVAIDRQAAAPYGINVADIQEIIGMGIGGDAVSQVFEGVNRFDIYLRFAEDTRSRVADLETLLVPAPGGVNVPLGQLAQFSLEEGPAQISRENAMRRIVIEASVRGRDQGGAVREAQGKVGQQVTLPPGYFIEWGGQFQLQQEANRRFAVVIPLTVFLILLMLYVSFNSLRHALLIIMNVPFALIGGIVALYLSGQYLSVPSSVGFITLFGVAVLNGVVMISYFNQLRREGLGLDDAVLKGAELRLRPILMTAAVASLGLIPLLLATGPGSEIQRPLATVVVGGLVSSTLLTLFVLPALYGWFERPRREVII